MIVQIDDREGERIEYAKKTYTKHEIELKHLETADFVFNNKVAFEYKTFPDFVKSVQDGRVVEQAIRLNQTYPYPFVMIQANEQELKEYIQKIYFIRKSKQHGKHKPQKFYEKNYYGAINSLNCYVTVLTCPTQYLAFQSMLNQAKKCLDGAPVNRKVAKTGSPAYQCLRYCIKGVGPKTTEKIVNTLGLKTVRDVVNVSVDDLVSVRGVSRSKAEYIVSQLGGLV